MPGKSLVLDANILVRAVLGNRVREVLERNSGQATFVPEAAYAEAEEHLAAVVSKRGGDPQKALVFLHALSDLVKLIGTEVTVSSRLRPANDWGSVIRKTGRSWPLHWHLAVPSGLKTRISLDAVWPYGRPAALRYFYASDGGAAATKPAGRAGPRQPLWEHPEAFFPIKALDNGG
jgi:hypothetical protein